VDVLRATLESALTQTYEHLELCIANAGANPVCRAVIDELAASDPRLRVAHLDGNRGISANSNAALELAHGDYVALLDHDDVLAPDALEAVVDAIGDDPLVDVLYSDEDRLSFGGERVLPYLKPEWSPEFLHSYMWVGHLLVIRRSLLLRIGGFRSEYDGSQDYDVMLRLAAATHRIRHVPKVLYHWRMVEGSAAAGGKGDARRTNLAALDDAVRAAGRTARVVEYPYANRVAFSLVERPLVSIVIPTDSDTAIRSCLESLAARTTYDALEIVVVTNSELAASLESEYRRLPLRVVRFDEPFNFSRKCNLGAAAADGRYLLFLNDDVEPLTEGWVESMLQYAQLPEIGGVSAKLLYSDDTIQYAGLVTGVPGIVGTAFHTWGRLDGSYHSMAICVRNTSCLTGACMLLRASDFWAVGGWDEVNTPISHSDLDLSYRLLEAGLRLVYTPFAELRHRGHESRRHAVPDESLPVGRIDRGADVYLIHRWPDRVGEDPHYTRGMRALLYEEESAYELCAPAELELPAEWWDRPRVLLVGHELSSTGAPAMLVEVASALKRAGMLVVIAVAAGGPLVDDCLAQGLPVVVDEAILQESERASRFIAGFDIVGANTVLSWPIVHAAHRAGKPCVWFVQESRFGVPEIQRAGRRARSAFKVADRVVFPSRSAAEWYREFGGAHVVVHYGIEDPSRRVSADPPFERLDDDRYVVHSGSLEARKGADVLVDAVRQLPPDLASRLHVFLLGRFLYDDYVESLRERARGMPSIVLAGEVPRDTGLTYVANADVFVCTSRDESGPVVVLEAMALARPVVSTAVGVAAEVIHSGDNGILVPVDDVKAVAEALERLLRDEVGRRRLGEAARQTYTSRLTQERYGEEIVGIFREVLSASSPGPSGLSAPAVARGA
jgi:GT2 family glycosyltransferase